MIGLDKNNLFKKQKEFDADYYNPKRNQNSVFTTAELDEARDTHLKIDRSRKILREVIFNIIFLCVLNVICFYSDRNQNSFYYQDHIQQSFVKYKEVFSFTTYFFVIFKILYLLRIKIQINNVQDFWKWISVDFVNTIKADKSFYNAAIRETYASFDAYLNDASSILVGYPILRQLRIKNGNLIFY